MIFAAYMIIEENLQNRSCQIRILKVNKYSLLANILNGDVK